MAEMKCETCQGEFEGRPNRKYCSIPCRRKAARAQREIKRKERLEAWLAAMTPEERAFYESCREWEATIQTGDQQWPDFENPWG